MKENYLNGFGGFHKQIVFLSRNQIRKKLHNSAFHPLQTNKMFLWYISIEEFNNEKSVISLMLGDFELFLEIQKYI